MSLRVPTVHIPEDPQGIRRHRSRHAMGFGFVTAAFASLMAFGTLPTPLWPFYEERDGFGAATVTVAFAMMVVGAALTFPTLGHLSDRFGRRRIIVPALIVGILAAAVLAAFPSLPGLLVGRFLTGVAVGLMASTATTYLADLYRESHPGAVSSPGPAIVSTAANLGGLAVGPLAAGILAEWAPAPVLTPYLVFGALMAVMLVLVLASPETVDAELSSALRPSRFAVRPGYRRVFVGAAATGFFAFAVMGLFSSLGAIIVRGQLGVTSPFIAGLAPFAAFAASAMAQLALGRLRRSLVTLIGLLAFPTGLAMTAVSLFSPSLALVLAAAGLAGAGAGLLFTSAMTQAFAAAEPPSRAGVLAAFFVVAYLGMGIPSVVFSVVIRFAPIQPSMIGFAAVLSAGAIVFALLALRSPSSPDVWRLDGGRQSSSVAPRSR